MITYDEIYNFSSQFSIESLNAAQVNETEIYSLKYNENSCERL